MSKHFGIAVLVILVFVFLTLATVSGRWTKDRELKDVWNEVGLWGECQCVDNERDNCQKNNQFFRVVQGFSLIAVIAEFLALFALAYEYFIARGTRNVFAAAAGLLGLALIANIISWTTFAAFFRKGDICEENAPSFSNQDFKLQWGFGVRLIELGLIAVALVFAVINMGKGVDRTILHKVGILVLLFLLMCTILTSSGRGWMQKRSTGQPEHNIEVGLWDTCLCRQMYNLPCIEARRHVYVSEVFSVAAIFTQFFLAFAVLYGAATKMHLNFQRFAAILGWIAQVIVIISYTEFAKTEFCGASDILDGQRLHWAYGISCVALIFQTAIVFALLFASPVEEPKPEGKTEPTNAETAAPSA
jgi:hypothetical protein